MKISGKSKKRIKISQVISDILKRHPKQKFRAADKLNAVLREAKKEETDKGKINILMSNYPFLTPKQICALMEWDHTLKGRIVSQRKYEWKISQNYEGGSQPSTIKRKPDSQHHVYAYGRAPVFLDRKADPGVTDLAVDAGWKMAENRNKRLLWRRDPSIGNIDWWETGKIRVHIRQKPQHLGLVKQLLSKAFFQNGLIQDPHNFSDFVDRFQWDRHHDEYVPPGKKKRLPHMIIKNPAYPNIRSIRMGDKSHPYSLEVEYVRDPIMEELRSWLEINRDAFQQFTEFMKTLSQPKRKQPKDSRGMYV